MEPMPDPTPVFDPALLRQARRQAELGGRQLMEVLEETLALPPEVFVASLASALHFPVLAMAEMQGLTPAFDAIPFAEAMEHECLAFRDADKRLLTVSGDPFNSARQAWLAERLRDPHRHYLAHPADIAAWLARQEDGLHAMDSALAGTDKVVRRGQAVEDLSLKAISSDTSPVVKLVHSTLYDAFRADASDIHLETGASGLTIKYRVDGVLIQVGVVDGVDMAGQILSRIKVMSELDIAESRIPQDGRFKVTMRGREIDLRVSIMPSIFGEDAVLRILDKQALADQVNGLRLDCLGFDAETIEQLQRLSAEPYGMLLVTGPTGSGKTTTLYAAITEINTGQDKIVTIEDPVEYQLPGVLQIPVNEKKGLTFARGLRSILRHDPDKIMVGEIRDPETAQIAVQSALTGHLVFTTVHANNVFDVIGRFMHMGVDLYSFVSGLNGVLAQRLVRVNCPHCSTPQQPDAKLLAFSRLTPEQVAGFDFHAGTGCGHCRGSGYKGRKAIAELLFMNDEIREMIVARQPIRLIKEAANRSGTRFLRDAALDLVRRGETTLQEINRVTFVA
ncbi:MAG: GspE/PulE family protein [Gallionellaceae bacterium]|nr:GspE/PulE family protein [Gallionellaceae bacterium]